MSACLLSNCRNLDSTRLAKVCYLHQLTIHILIVDYVAMGGRIMECASMRRGWGSYVVGKGQISRCERDRFWCCQLKFTLNVEMFPEMLGDKATGMLKMGIFGWPDRLCVTRGNVFYMSRICTECSFGQLGCNVLFYKMPEYTISRDTP